MRVITWNLNKRRNYAAQVAALAARQPDIIALQEVTANTRDGLRVALAEIGLNYAVDSAAHGSHTKRGYVMIACRYPLQPLPFVSDCFPESAADVLAATPFGQLHIHAVHVPTWALNAERKNVFMDEIYTRLAHDCPQPRILCGDFNAPQRELDDGTLITFGQRKRASGSYEVRRGYEGQDSAERAIFRGLAAHDLVDVYRALHGFGVHDCSWVARNRGREFGFRLDHIFASASLQPVACSYLHEWRTGNLSDHAAVEAVFSI
jgi:exonuclease III